MSVSTLDEQLAALVGKPIGDSGPSRSPDPVNQPMIRHWAAAFEDWNPVYTEYRFGTFHREFQLSEDIDPDGVSARMRNGVLELHLPKTAAHRPRAIPVRAG